MRNFNLSFLICLGLISSIWGKSDSQRFSLEESFLSSKPLHEIATLGAPTTGSLVEGCVGAIHKGCRHRFHCYSSGPISGFLGPQTIAQPLSLKDQPGIFPAPLMGPASLTFTFHCQSPSHNFLTPIVVRPDGTVFQGLPMTQDNSPQTLVISSPAQTGIYTLFILAHEKNARAETANVDVSISTQPHNQKTIQLKSFDPTMKDAELISAEFTYIPSS